MKKQNRENKILPKIKGKRNPKEKQKFSLNSDIVIFPKNKLSIPDLVQTENKKSKDQTASLSVKNAVDELKTISKKYDETIQNISNKKETKSTTNNKNINVYNQNPDLFFREMQKTISIVNNKSVITPTKGENNAVNITERSNITNNSSSIFPNTNEITNNSNYNSISNYNPNKTTFTTNNKNNNINESRLSDIKNTNYIEKNPSYLTNTNLTANTKQFLNSSINQTYPTRIQEKGLNFIKLPNQKEKIPSFAEGGNISVKGSQMIEVGSDKNNAPIEESITISPKIKSSKNSQIVEELKTFSKNILTPFDIVSPQNITNSIKKTIEQIKVSTTDLNRKSEKANNAGTGAVGQPITVNNSPNSVTNNSTSVKSMTTFEKVVMESEWYPRHKRIFG